MIKFPVFLGSVVFEVEKKGCTSHEKVCLPYNEFVGMEIDKYGLLLGFETWDPGNIGRPPFLSI